jgi:energy-coupling factor transporter ATP-binding protein EcfA2
VQPNLARFLSFLGWQEGEVLELQALHVPEGRWSASKAAHASTLDTLVRLADQADRWKAQGVYVLFNRIDPGVQHRRGPDAWHLVPKGEGTTDRDIVCRRALYFDFDPQRTRGISATDAELQLAANRAIQAGELLARFAPPEACGAGLSGNGLALFVALAERAPDPEAEGLIKASLVAMAALLDDASVKVDVSVSDPKRICPAFGTHKRKGAPSPQRPHRRSAFLGPESPYRLSHDELRGLVAGLRRELPDHARSLVDEVLRGASRGPERPSPLGTPSTRSAPEPTPRSASSGRDAFRVANEIPVREVLARLGQLDGDQPTCPGCGERDGGVAVVGNGLKCSHNRCAHRGHRNGFRTVVDLVMEVQRLDRGGALRWLREQFPGAEIPERAPAAGPPPPAATPPSSPGGTGEQGPRSAPRLSKLQKLVRLLESLSFFRSPTGRLFLEQEGAALACDSEGYVEHVASLFWGRERDVVGASAIEDATRVVAGQARTNVPAPIRVAGDVHHLLFDLGQGAPWLVTADDITPLDDPPPFYRPDGSLPLPRPELSLCDEESAAVFAELRQVLDLSDDLAWASCLAWLAACLRPVGPYPILIVRGEKGSGKTTLSKILRRLVDPREPQLKVMPKGSEAVRTLAISAEHAHVVGFDNLSHLDGELSDALCRLSTGDGFEARKLWRGRALDVFVACRPILLNGISDAATRADLLDRSLLPPRLPARSSRLDDDQIETQVAALVPRVLGALLWAVHRGLGQVERVDVPGQIRMRSAARWATAMEAPLGLAEGAVVMAYLASREESDDLDVEDPVAVALMDWLDSLAGPGGANWEGTAEKLLAALTAHAYPSGGRRPPGAWPETGKGMGTRLDRLAGSLRAKGVTVEKGTRRGHGGVRLVSLSYHPASGGGHG